jgi:hypothetical protein
MDPLSILATAQAAYGALQAGIAAGKEIQGMAADLSDLWGSVAKLTHMAAERPQQTIFNKKSVEQMAIERYAAKAEAHDLALKAKNLFVGRFGLAAWDQVQREVIAIRKEIEREKWEQRNEKARKLEELQDAAVITGIVLLSLTIIAAVGVILFGM